MVHFVGAGCGAADLITVRGARLLSEADVVIYAGSLVNPEPVSYTHLDVYKRQLEEKAVLTFRSGLLLCVESRDRETGLV